MLTKTKKKIKIQNEITNKISVHQLKLRKLHERRGLRVSVIPNPFYDETLTQTKHLYNSWNHLVGHKVRGKGDYGIVETNNYKMEDI